MRRKLFCFSLSVMAGIVLADFAETLAWIVLLIALLFLWKNHSHSKTYVCALIFGMILLLLFQFRFTHGAYHGDAASKEAITVTGVVTDVEKKEDAFYRFTMNADGERILAACYQELEEPWQLIGSQVTFSGELSLPAEAGNPRTFDYRRYLLSRGIEYTGVIEHFSIDYNTPAPYYRMKRYIMEKRETYIKDLSLGSSAEGLLRGLLFGDKNQLDETVYDEFRKNGTAHVLAVSGLHVGMLYSLYRTIHSKWKNRWVTVLFLAFLFVYGTASLWAVSVTRAVGLILIVLAGKAFARRYDLLTALSAMALFCMVKNPYCIFGAGFQMSFLAVLSIAFLERPFRKLVGYDWSVPFAVQAGLLPYMAYTFNYVSFVGILCNVPVIYLTSLLVPAGMAGFVLYLLLGNVIPGFSIALETVTEMMIWCNRLFVADGMLSFDVVSPPLWMVVLVYGMMFLCASEYWHIYFHRNEWKRVIAALLLVVLCTGIGWEVEKSPFDKAELVFVDVGQGDCLHIKTESGMQVLIDGGGKFGYNTGEKTLKPYLLKNRIGAIDLAAATHLHLDHYAGIQELADCYPVHQVLTEGKAGQKIVLGKDYWLEILWPKVQNPDTDDENENSLIFMVHHKGLKTLITGDITEAGEEMLLQAYQGTDLLKADILKIAHHGSPYSSSDDFLDAVKPKIAVISVGRNNYGHPSEIVIEKLSQKGIMVFRTDLDGAVGIINRKGTISVCTEKQR